MGLVVKLLSQNSNSMVLPWIYEIRGLARGFLFGDD